METKSPFSGNCKGSLIIFIHGLTGDKDEQGLFSNFASRLGKIGIEVWRFDMPGSGHRKGEPITASSWIEEASAAVDEARKRGYKRVILLGLSLGGYVALEVAKRERIEGLVLWAPLMDSIKREELLSDEKLAALKERGHTIVKGHILPEKLFKEIESIDQKSLIKELSAPIFIAHGTEDKTIPWQMSKNGAEVSGAKLHLIKGAGHLFKNHWEELYSSTEDWLFNIVCKD